MRRTYKYRIYPTKEQKTLIIKTFGCVRFIYNHLLSDKIAYYKENKKTLKREVSYYKNMDEYSFLKEVDSLALANAKINLETAYKNFFEKRAKFPKFKKRKNSNSYKTNNVNGNIKFIGSNIKLPKLGVVKTKLHRPLEGDKAIKSCTITQKGTKFYINILLEENANVIEAIDKNAITFDKVIGFDYSSHDFYVDSNGNIANYPRYYRKAEKKLKKLQRKLSKMVYGSKNYYKQLLKAQNYHEHVANQRKDFIFKTCASLIKEYDVFCFEDLNLSNMKRTLHLGKSTSDNGFSIFRTVLQYKCEEYGKYFIKVDKFYASSKLCHVCGYKNTELTLKDREWTCPVCHTFHNRDYNAAINIKTEGYRLLLA